MRVTIDEILKRPFLKRSDEEKLQIISDGRPLPPLGRLWNVFKKWKNMEQYSNIYSLYNSFDWLTGCNKRQKFFCWPCVLFCDSKRIWNRRGFYGDKNNSLNIIKCHQLSNLHIKAVLDLHMFSKYLNVPVVENYEIETSSARHNDLVGRNRGNLERIVGVICYMVSREQSCFSKRDDRQENLIENCLDLLTLMDSQPVFSKNENNAFALLEKSPSLFTDLVYAITDTLKNAIKEEILSVPYVSIILSETSETSTESQIATHLRYVKNSTVCERFLGFTSLVENKTPEVIFKHISDTVEKYELLGKLKGQCYDGSLISNEHLKDLITLVRNQYPLALFVPCYSHDFQKTLQQGLSHIRECEIFFKNLSGIETYVSETTKRREAFQDYMVVYTRYYSFSGRFAAILNEHWNFVVWFFEILINEPDRWDTDDIVKAQGCLQFLLEFQTVFLLQFFDRFFELTEGIQLALKSDKPENIFNSKKIEDLMVNVLMFKECEFEPLWSRLLSNQLAFVRTRPNGIRLEMEVSKLKYCKLFHKITDCMLQLIEVRGKPLEELNFFNLLNCQFFRRNNKTFPEIQFRKLISLYGNCFNSFRLKKELTAFYSHSAFTDKTVEQILDFLMQDESGSIFIEVLKLAQLLLSLPCKKTQDNYVSSTMESYKKWAFSAGNRDLFTNNWIFLRVEKDSLLKLKSHDHFYNDVIYEFQKRNSTM